MTQPSHDTFAAFIGIDWADAKHDLCLQAAGTAKRERFQLEHTPEAIDAWVTTLRTRFNGHPVACLPRTGQRAPGLRFAQVRLSRPLPDQSPDAGAVS